mmetsp:Transcript_20039/g.28512  ORF Transcript_20039/g.28512 Transcript_20039/m.28512 type:complete len:1183 (+) Transcript_20039:210-3758(+)|eukprot:CAMPEP_0172421002 /NCGR_PEP_ID=MMETSP1064-20121228/7284_1 /TAXON_ID=202472 /ORGANISM="Aulacoseira subarctica , Strain CCAP 1002/5" /LENGTH=1182 /DNA_ID=CAMNT_0013161191 /DNA_START=153 /DNA_END=3701 /DNA_ORIENTATION=+
MAPREANPNYADQYLCVDYDGIGLLPNDPSPPMQMESEDEDDLAAAAAAIAASNNNNNNVEPLTLADQQQPTAEVPTPVDPLSIDPSTYYDNNIMYDNTSDLHMLTSLLSNNTAEESNTGEASFSFAVSPDHSSTSIHTNITRARLTSSVPAAGNTTNNLQFFTTAARRNTDVTVLSDDSPLMEDSSMEDNEPSPNNDFGGMIMDTPISIAVRRIAEHTNFQLSITNSEDQEFSTPEVATSASPPILNFGPNTTLTDLKYFAERGCIVPLLSALKTPKLTALGARLLADYAKNQTRRVAVAGNKRILEFTLRTMHGRIGPPSLGQVAMDGMEGGDQESANDSYRERAVEYAVETIRSLTATEESDVFLMNTPDLMVTLATVARGGTFFKDESPLLAEQPYSIPFSASTPDTTPLRSRNALVHTASVGATPATHLSRRDLQVRPISRSISTASSNSHISDTNSNVAMLEEQQSVLSRAPSRITTSPTSNSSMMISPSSVAAVVPETTARQVPINSKSRLHACIAIMNLSCGKANKIEIAKIPQVLTAMRDVMMETSPTCATASSIQHASETRLKATTCIKNLSNADANDSALLISPKLVEALGHVILVSIRDNYLNMTSEEHDAEASRRRSNLTVTNACLALMNLSIAKANKRRVFRTPGVMEALMAVITKGNGEARVKSCSALSNLAIGYDNKIPMFHYPGFVEGILHVIETDHGEARTKACSIVWSFAAEMRNQVPVVQRGDILPVLVRVAEEDNTTEARFKCVAALTLLAESLENALPLLESGALQPLMEILHESGPDPTQWQGQTASWCVGFLMNIAQSDDAVVALRNAGVVELLAPLLTLDHYQSLKAAMAVTFVCRFDEDDSTYDLLRKTESVIPKIISLLHNTLTGKGGNGYKYGVFTLRSSVGCISSLASGPDFMKERMATAPVFDSLLKVLCDFCVDCTPGAIVGGGKDDAVSATLSVQALHDLTGHLVPSPGTPFPFGSVMEERLITALGAYERSTHPGVKPERKQLAMDTRLLLMGFRSLNNDAEEELLMNMAMAPGNFCCDFDRLCSSSPILAPLRQQQVEQHHYQQHVPMEEDASVVAVTEPVRTFLLSDKTGRRFAVPIEPSGGRSFNDNRLWCYRRGRFCLQGETPDPNFVWTQELQEAYALAVARQQQNVKDKKEKTSTKARSRLFC